MHSKKIEDYKKNLKLSKQQKEILIGLMLGDGHLETQDNRTYRLKVEHSIKQKLYTDWLYRIWNKWVLTKPKTRIKKLNGKHYQNYYFSTISHGALRFYAQQFYRAKKKVVPRLIHRWLTPLAFAIWFMDDGSIKSKNHQARILNTQGFDKKDVRRLAEVLQMKFDLKTSLRKQREGYQIMIAGGESAQKLYQLLDSHILPSMRYKLPLNKEVNTIA